MSFFFFNDTATTEIYTLSLHDALPISSEGVISRNIWSAVAEITWTGPSPTLTSGHWGWDCLLKKRSEEHTSELQSRLHLVCRLLLEKKKLPPPSCHHMIL